MAGNRQGLGASLRETGSHASHRTACGVDGPSGFDPARVTVAFCNSPCDHDFQGWRRFEGGGEQVCSKCGMGAMEHSLWTDE